jgi:glutathione S-transferase
MYFRTWAWLPPLLGLVWIVGRALYMTGYMAAPEKRETGFMTAAVALLALLILSIVGIVQSWMALNAV